MPYPRCGKKIEHVMLTYTAKPDERQRANQETAHLRVNGIIWRGIKGVIFGQEFRIQ
jgi:hypothetical protein